MLYIIFTSFHPFSVVAYMFQFDILSHGDLYVSSKSFLASLLNVVVKDFDAMLDTHQNDDEVKKVITEIMTAGSVKPSINCSSFCCQPSKSRGAALADAVVS